MSGFIFTSESVAEGHPDKVCDQVSDAIVDLLLTEDPEARAGIECLATTDTLVIAGEMRCAKTIEPERIIKLARQVVKDIGYEQQGFHHETMNVQCLVHAQSADIAVGVDSAAEKDEGAGDQGIMFGYACSETPDLMPAPIFYAHKMLRLISEDRHAGKVPQLGPDAKGQVSMMYHDNGLVDRPTSIVLSTQHAEGVSQADVREIVKPYLREALGNLPMPAEEELYINPTGRFVIGGPDGDCGLTGRKIIVDTYGGAAPHGGGAFSGKDPTKVDRSAAYAARYLAKNVVAAGLARRCTIQLSYAIGVSKPLSVYVNMHDTSVVTESQMSEALQSVMDLSPRGIRTHLKLNKPIYRTTSAYGHFGRAFDPKTGAFSWENTDLIDAIHNALK